MNENNIQNKTHEPNKRHINRTIKRIAMIAVLIMAILSIVFYFIIGSANISALAAVSVTTNMCGLVLIAALFVLIMGDHREITHSDALFLITLMLISVALFAYELGWFLEERPGLGWAVQIAEIVGILCGTSMIFSFYKYLLSTALSKHESSLKPLTIALGIICGIIMLLALSNPFTGLIFTIDEFGRESFGPCIFIFYLEGTYPIWLLAYVWVFVSIYDGNRRKLESKQHDIEVADSVFNSVVPKDGEDITITPEMQKLIDEHTIPDAMKLTEMLTRERVRRMKID